MGKKKSDSPASAYVRLTASSCEREEGGARRGYFPVLVGKEEGVMERHVIPTRLIRHPYIVGLLEMSAREFGYQQQGVLRIPCDAECFKQMVARISKKK